MITKAEILSINRNGNYCVVSMPLFQSASSITAPTAEALVSITPGLFNNLFVGDIVFVGFEENALEKPIILGKLYKGSASETRTQGGSAILNSLKVNKSAVIPSSTLYDFSVGLQTEYSNLSTPKKTADYIKWLEQLTKKLISQLDTNFRCFKNWVLWKLKAENLEIDDGDLDDKDYKAVYGLPEQDCDNNCLICGSACLKNKSRQYLQASTDKEYPEL